MKTEQRKFVLKGEVDLALSNANSVFDKIQKFKNELSNLELPKDAARGMEKSFERLQKAVGEFQILASRGIGSLSDSKEINKAWKSVQREINGLELNFKNIGVADIFPKDIQLNIKGATEALAKYADKVKEIRESKGYKDKLTQKAEKSNEKDLIKKQLGQATKTKIARQAKLESAQSRKTESEKQLEKERKVLEALRKERELYIKESKKGELELKRDALIKDKYIKGNKSSGYDISSRAITADDEKTKEAREILAQLAAIEETSAIYDAEIKRLDGAIESESTAAVKAVGDAQKAFNEINREIESYENQIKDAEKATADIDAELDKMVASEAEEIWKELAKAIKEFIGVDLSEQVQDIEAVQNAINDYQTSKIETLPELFRALSQAMGDIAPAAKRAAEGFGDVHETLIEGERAAQEIDNLKNQVLDFFSLTNSVELFKRAIQSAIDTIKELDAVMTETAVVTDFSIGDMWDKLPQYSKQASSLGSSIAELYSATTLYYQQGLKTNEAMGVGVETMKMARIANMDAEQATTAMTAALRGFNMEVNELNAQRVSDVYSELAAISAADTNQIATAMGKTASIAASANMEFETTAAFLTQIIETTQEAPETAGTALKTIVARFTEVKELFSEGMLTGQDTEGEEININKIDEALRTVGISLKDFLNGSKGMDDIFLELASKWDSLDLATQRYIATAAAGSRQQSRFIAMMSNYSRTVELVGAANNSAGASQEQYSKTLESLDTKLQQLKNAWDTFAMGLANDETIKVAVDALRIILETINKIIDALSGGNGVAKSLISLGAAFGILKIGGTAFEALFATVKQAASKEGLKSGQTFATAFADALKDRSGKSGSYIKSFFGDKELKKELTAGKSLSEALGKVDFNKFTDSMKKNLKEGILEDFDFTVKAKKIEIPDDRLAALREDFMNTEDITAGVDKLNAELGDTENHLKLTEKTAAKATATMEQGFGKAAAVAAGMGMILTGVAKIFENYGHERGAEGFEALASGATVLAGILTVLPGLLKAFGVAASTIPVIGVVVGVITALIYGGVALSKWIETDTEKLERLNEEAKEAADAANEAKKAYDELLSGQSDYEGLQKELEDLTRGTDEWRQKLVEANDQVLKLLEIYPELAKHITRGADGQLTIAEDGWKEVQGLQEETWKQAQYEAFDAKSAEYRQANKVQLNELAGKLYTDEEGASTLLAAYSDERTQGIFSEKKQTITLGKLKTMFETNEAEAARIWDNSGINGRFEDYYSAVGEDAVVGYYSAELTQLAEQVGMSASQIVNSETTLSKYLNDRERADIQGSGQAAALILSSTDFTSDFERKAGEGLVRGFTQNATEGFENSEEAVAEFNKLIDALGKIKDVNLQNTYSRYLSLDAGRIGREDYSITGRSFLENMGFTEEGLNKNPEELKKFASYYGIEGETYWDFINGFRDMFSGVIATAKAEIETTIKNTSRLLEQDYITGKAFLNNATNDQIKAYSEILTQAYGEGEPTGNLIVGQLDKILAGAGDKLPQMLEYLATTDFRQEGAAASFIQWLKELGISLNEIDLNGFQKDLENLSKGFKRIDLKALLDETKNLYDLADDLKSRKSSEGLSQDEYDALIGTGKFDKKDFYWTGQEWQYIGGSMEDLSSALAENTEAILSEKQQEVQDQIDLGKRFERNSSNIFGEEINGRTWTTEQLLSGEVTDMDAIRKIYKETEGYSDAQVKAWYDEARFAYERLAINESQLADYGAATEQASTMGQDAGILAAQGNIDALKAQAGHYDVTTEAIEAYRDALEAADNSLSEQDDHLYAIGITLGKTKKILDDNASAWGDYIDQIKSGDGLEKQIAVGNLAKAVNSAFGASIEASDLDDVAVEMLQKWIDGSEEAGKEFSQILGKSMQEELREQLDNSFLVMQKQIDALNAQDLTIGASISVDDTGLQSSMKYTEEEMKRVMAYWNRMAGITLEFEQSTSNKNGLPVYTLKGGTFTGFGSGSGSKKSGGGGGSSAWKNPYDKFYNTIERINEELRIREKLERRYQQLLKSSEVSASKLIAESREQLASLEKELKMRKQVRDGRDQEIQDLQAKNSNLTQYAKWNDVDNIIEIDYELLAKLEGSKNEKLTTAVEEYINKLEDLQDKFDEEVDAIYDIEDSIEEIKERGKDQYFDLENQVKDALVSTRQNEIDKLQEINDTLNDTNQKLIGAIQDSLAKQRQERENQRTEEELADKRARLSYLQMDTSGANALEIMELEEEIRQQEEDYTDSLIDQKISELEKQNDEAARQRQYQIELMQYQLSFYKEYGEVWNDVYGLLDKGIDENGIIVGSELDVILKEFEGFDGMSALAKLEYLQEINTKVAQALDYLEIGRQLENIGVETGKVIKFYYNGEELEGTVDASGNVKTADGRVFDNVFQGFGGKYYAGENKKKIEFLEEDFQADETSKEKADNEKEPVGEKKYRASITSTYTGNTYYGIGDSPETAKEHAAQNYKGNLEARLKYEQLGGVRKEIAWNHYYKDIKDEKQYKLIPYKTGGLADFTGPAWLDGTKSKPEYILNAEQTKSFFTLVDILSSLDNHKPKNENTVATTIDVDINIETVKEEADVDMLADKVQKAIVTSAQYRNNNFIQR